MIARFPIALAAALLLLGCERLHAQAVSSADPTGTCPSTITHSSSQAITQNNSVSCNTGPPASLHFDTSYWRAFNMATFTGAQRYDVTSVSFAIELARSKTGLGQPVTIRLYASNGGVFPSGSRTQIATRSITLMDTTFSYLTVPLIATVPAGTAELVMEVFTPSGQDCWQLVFHRLERGGADGPELSQRSGLREPDTGRDRSP